MRIWVPVYVSFNKFNSFVEAVAEKKHDLGSDTLKVMLTNVAPDAADTVKTDITDISAGNGYTAGGDAVAISSSEQTAGVYKLVLADNVWTASGGAIAAFRYAVLYNDTASNDELIGWHDYGSSITVNDGETFTWDASAANGVLTLT